MEQLKWRQIALIISPVILLPMILFLLLHLSPSIAIRTHVFMEGHPIIAITKDIKEDNGYYQMDKVPQETFGTSSTNHFTISKHGFLYFAHDVGFA